MRYLVLIALLLPNLVAASPLEANKRYLCEAETTFGWDDNGTYETPKIWVSRNKFVIEPAKQEKKQDRINEAISETKITHTIKGLGKESLYYCVASEGIGTSCFKEGEDEVLGALETFNIVKGNDNEIRFAYHALYGYSLIRMTVDFGFEMIAFEGGKCLPF